MAHIFVRNIAGYSDYLAKKGELKIKPKQDNIRLGKRRGVKP